MIDYKEGGRNDILLEGVLESENFNEPNTETTHTELVCSNNSATTRYVPL